MGQAGLEELRGDPVHFGGHDRLAARLAERDAQRSASGPVVGNATKLEVEALAQAQPRRGA